MYDLHRRTTQALNNLAIVYAIFGQAGANLEVDISEGDLFFADVRTAMEVLTEAQQNQERLQGELKNSWRSLDIAIMDVQESTSKLDDCRDLHDAACRSLEGAGKRTTETKRKAEDAHDRIRTHRDRCRRATMELQTADSLGRMGQL